MINLNEQITAFALHLIEREAEVRSRKNKRSPSEHEKFLLSTGWLCKKLLAVHAAQCPSDMIDQIGGWATAGVGQAYGEGYGMNSKLAHLKYCID